MHVTVSSPDLLSGATATLAAVPSKPAHPILGAIVLDANDDALQLSGFDYETSARTRTPAQIHTPGKVAVSGKLLAQVAKLLPKKPLELTADGEYAGSLRIASGRASFTLPLMDVRDFPALPQSQDQELTVDPGQFAQAVKWAAVAASADSTVPVYSGVRLATVGEDLLEVVATDGHRVHSTQVQLDAPAGFDNANLAVLVPVKPLETAVAALSSDDRIGLHLGESVTIAGDRLVRTTPIIDAEFPTKGLAGIFGKDVVGTAYISTAELIGALKRAASLTKRKIVRLSMTDTDSIVVGTERASDFHNDEADSAEEIDAGLEGNPPDILVNGAYLAEALAGVKRESVTLSFTGETTPILGNLNQESTFAVMPLRSV